MRNGLRGWKARFAQPSAEEQYQSAMRAEALRERAIAFDARLANELAEQQYAREAKARKSHFVQGLLGAIVAPLAQAGADRLSGYGGRGYYGNYSRGGYYGSGQAGYYPGTGYAGGVDPGRRTIPARSYCNPRAGEYCP